MITFSIIVTVVGVVWAYGARSDMAGALIGVAITAIGIALGLGAWLG